jgi:8-oxo-dGTP pyrophosphatase MutT (NUDIX family)
VSRYDYSCATFIGGKEGFIVVRKHRADGTWSPWHLPNGKKDEEDYDEVSTALREVREETGIPLDASDISHIFKEKRTVQKKTRNGFHVHPYIQHYFAIYQDPDDLAFPLCPEDHDHQARLMTFEEFESSTNFDPWHRRFIKEVVTLTLNGSHRLSACE